MSRTSKPKGPATAGEMVLQVPSWNDLPWLVQGFSTRRGGVSSLAGSRSSAAGGDLNLGQVAWDSKKNVLENRRRLLARLQADEMKLALLRQIHSDLIRLLDGAPRGGPPAGDGMISDRPGLLLAILAADCLPVLLVDTKQRVVAALHCGWRGTARRMAQKGVGVMKQRFGSREKDLRAAIGPGIRACCYDVGEEVREEFEGQFSYAPKLFDSRREHPGPLERKYPLLFNGPRMSSGRSHRHVLYLDLVLANVCQLREAGVAANHIYSEAPCASCHPELFFSHRRDAGRAGRMMGVIGIKGESASGP